MTIGTATRPERLKSQRLEALWPEIGHGFFTRRGGESVGLYAELNVGLGSDDERESVLRNRSRVMDSLGATFLATPIQHHTADVYTVEEPWPENERPVADALVTKRAGISLAILTADCGPVLFADPVARIVGAAHAGWKGAFSGVLEATVNAMETLGARRSDIVATLGPTISSENYEVGPEFVERFCAEDPGNKVYFTESGNDGHAMFDLPAYILARLDGAGVSADWMSQCTYGDEDRFFSYRRATHRGEPDYGRQISAILIGN